jgi:hypothetical protein
VQPLRIFDRRLLKQREQARRRSLGTASDTQRRLSNGLSQERDDKERDAKEAKEAKEAYGLCPAKGC